MIENFEKETNPLSEYEKETLLPIMVKCLERKIGKDNAVTNRMMCTKMEEYGYDICETRVRKIINNIRLNNYVSCLVATGKGYHVAETPEEVKEYIRSLKGREDAIKAVRVALEEQIGISDDSDCN